MFHVRSFEIQNFWGNKYVHIDFKPNVNFLIGVNGSGKTTIINLLSAILRADYVSILSSPFSKATVKLRSRENKRIPVITVEKIIDVEEKTPFLRYSISEKSSDEPVHFDVHDVYSRNAMRAFWDGTIARTRGVRTAAVPELSEKLTSLLRITWLSIHRDILASGRETEEGYETAVDRKTKEISSNFSKYFSLLNALSARETKQFQEFMFLSLLYKNREKGLLNSTFDVDADRRELSKIFDQLGVGRSKYDRRLDEHFVAVKKSRKIWEEKSSLYIEHIAALNDNERIHEVVQEWHKLQERNNEIYRPKILFTEIMNKLLANKKMKFNERNLPVITTQSGKELGPEHLSSGEKQLFILLGETLLQENSSFVFIADEPELSLHVSWQSELVGYMTKLNANAQLIFATHSPDVVGQFSNNIIEIEECMHNAY